MYFDGFVSLIFSMIGIMSLVSETIISLTLFDMEGGGHDAPPKCFSHCAQTLRRRRLKLGDF